MKQVTQEKRQRGQRQARSRTPHPTSWDTAAPIDVCTCGHVVDEHDGSPCAVENCPCIHYERQEST